MSWRTDLYHKSCLMRDQGKETFGTETDCILHVTHLCRMEFPTYIN